MQKLIYTIKCFYFYEYEFITSQYNKCHLLKTGECPVNISIFFSDDLKTLQIYFKAS